MEVLKAIQEQLIGEEETEEVFLKEKGIAADFPGIPAADLAGGSKDDGSCSEGSFVLVQCEAALPFL